MDMDNLIATIDSEIAVLKEVRGLLTGNSTGIHRATNHPKKRTLSAEARERIAAAQKKRWAAWKKKKAAK